MPLDRLINLDYINQYEKIRRALPLRPRGRRRARDLAGHALRLCQPRPDPLRAVAGFAQPPLPRRGRPRPEGAPGAVAGAARLAQFRCRSAGAWIRRSAPSPRTAPIYRGVNCVDLAENDTLEHTATLLWDVTGVDPFAPDNLPAGVRRDARDRGSRAPRRADRPRHCGAGAGRQRRSARLYPRRRWPRHGRRRASCGCWSRPCSTREPSAEPLHLQIANAWAPDNKHARRSDPPRAGAARRS